MRISALIALLALGSGIPDPGTRPIASGVAPDGPATSYSVTYPHDRPNNRWPTISVKGTSVTVYRLVASNNCAAATGVVLVGVDGSSGRSYNRRGTGKLAVTPGKYSHRTLGRSAILSPCTTKNTYFGSHISYTK